MDYKLGQRPPQAPQGSLQDIFTSPLFMMGASVLGADNVGSGLAQGAKAAQGFASDRARQQMQQQALQMRQQAAKQKQAAVQQEQQQKQQRNSAFQAYLGSSNLPMGVPELAGIIGPDKAAGMLFKQKVESSGPGRLMNVDGNLIAIEPGKEPRIIYKKAPSLAERLMSGAMQPQGGQVPQPGGVIQQNFEGASAQDPNLQLTAGNAAPQPAQDTVQIPGFPPMLRAQAESLRSAFALEGNKAGFDLLDSVLSPASEQIGEAGSNVIDKEIINSGNALSRLQEIQRLYDPSFQTIETKFGMALNEWRDKFQATRGDIPPEERAQMEKYRKYRVASIDNINRYIKEITGAQMSEAEATRLRQGVPDAGDGIFSGDGPTTFKAKMDQTIRTLGLAQMRMHYLKRNGFAGNGNQAAGMMSLQQMENIVEQRAQELKQEALAQGLTDRAQAAPYVQQRLKQEFGI